MATKNDKVILDLKKKIEEKKKLIGKSTKFSPVTNCNLELNKQRYNLNVCGKEELVYLLGQLKVYDLIDEIDPEEKLISGFPISAWKQDVLNRYRVLSSSQEKERLKVLENQLHNLLSVDTKVSLEIDNLKALI